MLSSSMLIEALYCFSIHEGEGLSCCEVTHSQQQDSDELCGPHRDRRRRPKYDAGIAA